MSAAPAPLLAVEELTMRFGGLIAVDGLSFSTGFGEITALIGPNGAGKTTVFNCLTGFYRPSGGRLVLTGKDGVAHQIDRLPGHQIARRAKIARTFQNIRLFPGMSVLENLLVAQHVPLMRASAFSLAGLLRLPGFQAAERRAVTYARHWLERLGLRDWADRPAGILPYGEQRRLEIGRAMCTGPSLLCLDEPAAGLNPAETRDLSRLLRDIRAEFAIGILLIEHDMGVVMDLSDKIVVLDHGALIAAGRPEMIRNDPAVIRAYLGTGEDESLPPGILADLSARPGTGPC